jgi:mono/diheme cytochrome c family protein
VAARLTRDRIVQRILSGGGGNMPAYSSTISPDDLAAVTDFLVTRR